MLVSVRHEGSEAAERPLNRRMPFGPLAHTIAFRLAAPLKDSLKDTYSLTIGKLESPL